MCLESAAQGRGRSKAGTGPSSINNLPGSRRCGPPVTRSCEVKAQGLVRPPHQPGAKTKTSQRLRRRAQCGEAWHT
ncbi:hypothetical protein NDU88_005272 [Pleurodeles waltl]|uniref:Uncharacterized protein n=1 Tax=Pleurodeles waltl TaxID=8319 RepID=A0AAV7L3J3_PLEWA|nr:hypothetical protein NDU88_005272 [Pleurodeles waltl]